MSSDQVEYFNKRSVVASRSFESLAVFSGGGVVDADTAILASRQNMFLALVRFHIIKGSLSNDIMSSSKLHLVVAIRLFGKEMAKIYNSASLNAHHWRKTVKLLVAAGGI